VEAGLGSTAIRTSSATFTDGTNVRGFRRSVGGGVYFRNAEWLGRVSLLHAFAQMIYAIIAKHRPGLRPAQGQISHTRELKTIERDQKITVASSATTCSMRTSATLSYTRISC